MKKLYNFRLEDNLIKQIDKLPGSRTAKIRNALQMYLQKALHDQQENVKTNDLQNGQNDLQLQHEKQDKSVNPVNSNVQVMENYELMEYLKRDNEWLKDRIEHFEHNQDNIFAKADAKAKKETTISLYRM
jgi:hypothetical protein